MKLVNVDSEFDRDQKRHHLRSSPPSNRDFSEYSQYEKDPEYETDSEYELDPDYQRDSGESETEHGVIAMFVAKPQETEFGYCFTSGAIPI